MGNPDFAHIYTARSTADLPAIASAITAPDTRVVLLRGELGAGKTALVSAICKVLGSEDEVSSPTFSLVNEYRDALGAPIYHIDLYRLDSADEVIRIGIEEYLASGAWCFIEWPEVILPLLSEGNVLSVIIEVLDDGSRRITTLK